MILKKMFSRQWIFTTVLALLGAALCIRLGIWQLDRLDQRRTFNAHYLAVSKMSPLDLNADTTSDLVSLEYRAVTVYGTYDFSNQVALLNYYQDGIYGYHLLTPLRLADGRAVLVDRGWIPADGNATPAGWSRYDGAAQAEVQGMLRLGVEKAPFGGRADPELEPGQTRLDFWNFIIFERLAAQIPYPILPVYIQPTPDPADTVPPIPSQPEIEITEGPHMGYALQWFSFATILLLGYPFFLRKQETNPK
jgi:surfeit locus 1 family protein